VRDPVHLGIPEHDLQYYERSVTMFRHSGKVFSAKDADNRKKQFWCYGV